MMIEDVILTTENCRYCLMCRHVCPVGHVTRKETLTPHGWGLTIASVRRGLLEWNGETSDVLYSCADCGTCQAHCVTDQPLPAAIAAARAEVAAANLAPAAAYDIQARLQQWGNPHAEQKPDPVVGQGEVALFVGDDACYLEPASLEAAMKLLAAVGIEPVLIGNGRNNGYLASTLGFPETAIALAEANLEELRASGASTLLVLSPGDYYVFERLYDERLGLEWPVTVTLKEVIVLLDERHQVGGLKLSPSADRTPYAYLDPTHSVRVKGRYDAPRRLLGAVLPGSLRELFWRRERTHPSGNVALQYTKPHIADHLTYSRLADVRQSGAQKLITEDAGTLAHLNRHTRRFGLEAQGLYKLLADHLV